MKKNFLPIIFLFLFQSAFAQSIAYQTFKDRWVINSFSTETLPKKKLDVRIAHRFGDMGGDAGGWPTFYGLETATDVSIGAEYGISDKLNIGFNRSKGAGQLKQLLNTFLKYKVLAQADDGPSFSLAVVGMTSISSAQKSNVPSSINFFAEFSHRMVHHVSVLAARKFSDKFSLQISGGATHRNVVPNGDENTTINIGLASRIQVTRTLGIIADVAVPFIQDVPDARSSHQIPIGIGFEFDTGGHIFQVNLTNATGIMPTDYLPYTFSNWGDGQFRLGFTISRMFNL